MKPPVEVRGIACIYCYSESRRCLFRGFLFRYWLSPCPHYTRLLLWAFNLQKEREKKVNGSLKVNGSPIWIPWWSRNVNQILFCVPLQHKVTQVPILISLSTEGTTHMSYKPLDLLFFSLAELAEGELSFAVFFLVFFLGVSSSSSSSLSSSVSESTRMGTS